MSERQIDPPPSGGLAQPLAQEDSQPRDGRTPLVAVIAAFVAIVVAWVASAFVLRMLVPDLGFRGQFGDSFGALNALFSGLAFGGVIYAIVLQRRELQYQREELELSRMALTKTALAAETSAREAYKARSSTAFLEVLSLLDKLRPHWHRAYAMREPVANWTEEEATLADKVATTLERVAYISKSGLLDPGYIMDGYAKVFVQCWKKLGPWVYAYRTKCGEPETLEAGGYQRKHFELFSRECLAHLERAGSTPAEKTQRRTGAQSGDGG